MRTLILASSVLALTAAHAGAQCLGDFNGDGSVSINELITAVSNSLVGCPTPGPRFVDNGDGTITDHQTELTWEKKDNPDRSADFTNPHDADNNYWWSGFCDIFFDACQPTGAPAADCEATVQGDARACMICDTTNREQACQFDNATVWSWVTALNSAEFAGHSDWRIPTIQELTSLVDYGATTPLPDDASFGVATCPECRNVPRCTCGYWSATTDVAQVDLAWIADFTDGGIFFSGVRFGYSVRAVRGNPLSGLHGDMRCPGDYNADGTVSVDEIITAVDNSLSGCPSPRQRFVDNGDGTVTDNQNSLMWEKLSLDQTVHNAKQMYTWHGASATRIVALNSHRFAGHSDWRLPTIQELETLVDYGRFNPAIDEVFDDGCTPGCSATTCSCTDIRQGLYWSSTTYSPDVSEAWGVGFGAGSDMVGGGVVGARKKTALGDARAVRTAP